jgi:hypothetical protein
MMANKNRKEATAKPKPQAGKSAKRGMASPIAKTRKNGRHFIPPNPPRDPAQQSEMPKRQAYRPTHVLVLGPVMKKRMQRRPTEG